MFPEYIHGFCRNHTHDLEYPWSLTKTTNWFGSYSHHEITRGDHGEGGKGKHDGFRVKTFGRSTLWQNDLRFGKWRRKQELWIALDRLKKERLKERRIDGHILAKEEAAVVRELRQQQEAIDSEIRRREVKRGYQERHVNSKWGRYVDMCANLLTSQSLHFAVEGDLVKMAKNLRGVLGMSRSTMHGRWSVKPHKDGGLLVVKIGTFDSIYANQEQMDGG